MAETSTNSFDRFNDALRNLDDQLQEMRDRFVKGRDRLEKEVRKRTEKIENRLKKNPIYKRADQVRKDVEEQVDRARSQFFEAFGIASKSELDRINRKLNTISKRLNELTKEQQQA